MRQWIKFYTEALHDRKMRRLDRFDKSVYYDILLLAGFEDKDGVLPCLEDIAFELDLTVERARKSISKLVEIGIISEDDESNLYVTNFQERQETTSAGYERVKRCRDKKKNSRITDNTALVNGNNIDNVTLITHDNGTDNVINDNAMITTDIDIDKDIEKEKEKEYILVANATKKEKPEISCKKEIEKTKKEKSSNPDDDAFWNVFKHKKELAIAFYKATGLYPMSKEFGHWQKDLDGFVEAGITVDVMEKAIRKIQTEGKIQYKSPGSVLSTARYLTAQKNQETAMSTEEVINNANSFKSAADMLRALAVSKQNEVVDL